MISDFAGVGGVAFKIFIFRTWKSWLTKLARLVQSEGQIHRPPNEGRCMWICRRSGQDSYWGPCTNKWPWAVPGQCTWNPPPCTSRSNGPRALLKRWALCDATAPAFKCPTSSGVMMQGYIEVVLNKGFPGSSAGKESTCNAGDPGSISELGSCPGGRCGNPLEYSYLENPHGQSLVGYSPQGHRVGHNWATKHTAQFSASKWMWKCYLPCTGSGHDNVPHDVSYNSSLWLSGINPRKILRVEATCWGWKIDTLKVAESLNLWLEENQQAELFATWKLKPVVMRYMK